MKSFATVLALLMMVAACGDDDDGGIMGVCDEEGGEACFELPGAVLSLGGGGSPNFNCAPDAPATLSAELTVSGTIEDYLSGDGVDSATLDIFFDNVVGGTPDLAVTADSNGDYSYTLPAGTPTIVAGHIQAPGDFVDVYGYRARYNESSANTEVQLWAISRASATQVYGLVSIPYDPGLGSATMAARDCDGEDLENAVATLSTTSSANGGGPSFVAGAYQFYGADGDLPAPVRRNVRTTTANNGAAFAFAVPAGSYFAQIWGFVASADMDAGRDGLTLIAEYPLVVVADAVSGTFMRPSQGPL